MSGNENNRIEVTTTIPTLSNTDATVFVWMQKTLDNRLKEALRGAKPAEISAAYKDLADFHFDQRNMEAADELYAFSALHASPSPTCEGSEYTQCTPRREDASHWTPRQQFEQEETRRSANLISLRSSSHNPTPHGANPLITLSLTILEAQHLSSLPVSSRSSQSLFCTVSLECPGKTSITARTELLAYSDSPKWNSRFDFRIDDHALQQGVVNVAIMSRRIFAPCERTGDLLVDSSNLELAVSRIGVVRSISLHQICSRNGTLQRWFTVAPAPEQEVGSYSPKANSKDACIALILTTSESKLLVSSRNSTPPILSPSISRSSSAIPLLSPRSDDSKSFFPASDSPGFECLEERFAPTPRPNGEPPDEIESKKRHITSDMARLKHALERKPESKQLWFESPAVIELTLSESFDAVCASQEMRRHFQDALAENVAAALNVARRQILVFRYNKASHTSSLRPHTRVA